MEQVVRRMVVCLVFSDPHPDSARKPMVLLVRKSKPHWRSHPGGWWNGPGGVIEVGESTADAASRETREECSVAVPEAAWRAVCTLEGKGFAVEVVTARLSHTDHGKPNPSGTEFGAWFQIDELPNECLPDVPWMVPLALDGRFFPARFTARPSTGAVTEPPENLCDMPDMVIDPGFKPR